MDLRELLETATRRATDVLHRLNLGHPVRASDAEPLLELEPHQLAVVAQRLRATATLSPAGALVWATSSSVGVDATVSLQRSGRARETALRRLSESGDGRVIPFLLLRLDDIVPEVQALAGEAVRARLLPSHALQFARCLGLVGVLGGRQRGQAVRAVREFLAAPAQRSALATLFDAADSTLRLQAFRLAVDGDPEVALRALADPAPTVRLWAARTLCSGQVPMEVRRRGVSTLETSRAPRVRLMALQAVARSPEELEQRWLFDAHSSIRYEARVRLKAAVPELPYSRPRELAIGLLRSHSTPPEQLVGALGTLADLGRAEDLALIEGFLSRHGTVRREARRTLRILGGLQEG